jgi:hypothetical protein
MAKKSKYDLGSLLSELEKTETTSGGGSKDYQSDFWKPTLEKGDERVEYTIRFLPNPDSKSNFPWVERAAHMFNFPSGKFIYEPCVKKAKKEKCYICEEVDQLYRSGDPELENMGAKRFSKKRYFHNILVVKDPRDGGKNEGNVLIYECGQQIHDKCIEFLKNKDLDPSERLYFHPTLGTNFKLVMTWKSNYQNYEKSDFVRKPSSIEIEGAELDLDEAEKFIEENCKGLNERLLSEKSFKEYDVLKNLYLNQGVVDETEVTSSRKPKKEEEVDVDLDDEIDEDDKTINDEPIEARNPKKREKKETEIEKDDSPLPDDDDEETSDEDAELEALLG